MYGVIAALGIAGRAGWIDSAGPLEQPWVIAAALAAFALEFVADKIPILDSVWDVVHTLLRPIAGAAILTVAPDQPLPEPVALALGGGLALTSHSAKAATRALVNTSPEPVSNAVVSTAEDGLVAALMALAFANPEVALAITVVLAVLAVGLIIVAWRLVRRFRRKRRDAAQENQPPERLPPPH